jgi:hypothetical protein
VRGSCSKSPDGKHKPMERRRKTRYIDAGLMSHRRVSDKPFKGSRRVVYVYLECAWCSKDGLSIE